MSDRDGSHMDVINLTALFKSMRFDVNVVENLSGEVINKILLWSFWPFSSSFFKLTSAP